jgi:hypothetical protein
MFSSSDGHSTPYILILAINGQVLGIIKGAGASGAIENKQFPSVISTIGCFASSLCEIYLELLYYIFALEYQENSRQIKRRWPIYLCNDVFAELYISST